MNKPKFNFGETVYFFFGRDVINKGTVKAIKLIGGDFYYDLSSYQDMKESHLYSTEKDCVIACINLIEKTISECQKDIDALKGKYNI